MPSLQAESLRLFTALRLLRPQWGGAILLGVRLDGAGRALALASLAAGAASLFLEEDAALLRTAQRDGCCTFTVTTLDEALRALKNEVRQRRAISVALRVEPSAALREMVERGVQPQATAAARPLLDAEAAAVAVLQERGAQSVSGCGLAGGRGAFDLEQALARVSPGWQIAEYAAASMLDRRREDAALLDLQPMNSDGSVLPAVNREWLSSAPTLFPREMRRALWQRDSSQRT